MAIEEDVAKAMLVELMRQAEASTTPSLCIYNDDIDAAGVDGMVDLIALAKVALHTIATTDQGRDWARG